MRIRSKLACLACSAFLIPIQAQAQWDAYTRAETALFEDGDARAAIWYLTPPAETGELKAQTLLASIYEYGSCGLRLANCYAPKKYLRPDLVEAVKWYRLLAEQGDHDAQMKLGSIYMSGRGGVPRSYGEAAQWYRLAAEQGDVDAHAALGTIYMTGGDIPTDYQESALWLRRAAEGGADEAEVVHFVERRDLVFRHVEQTGAQVEIGLCDRG